jgi:hypothetical protein
MRGWKVSKLSWIGVRNGEEGEEGEEDVRGGGRG